MVTEDVSNSATTSSAQTAEEHEKKRYKSDDSIASMLGDKLDNFTAAFLQDEVAQASKVAPPEEILTTLNQIPGLEEDDLLAAYDILVSNDLKFKSLMALPEKNEEEMGTKASQAMNICSSEKIVLHYVVLPMRMV